MKTSIIYFAIVSAAVLLLGALFKVMHWPGASELILAGRAGVVFGAILLFVLWAVEKKGPKGES